MKPAGLPNSKKGGCRVFGKSDSEVSNHEGITHCTIQEDMAVGSSGEIAEANRLSAC
jgi:hypothetical protein